MKRRFLLDTGPAQDFLFRRAGIAERVNQVRSTGAVVGICVPVLGEVIAGLENSSSRERSLAIARPRLQQLVCWSYEQPAGYVFGKLLAELRRTGRPMQQIDVQIASIALNLGNCTVVTYDSDFAAIPGLSVVDWRSPV